MIREQVEYLAATLEDYRWIGVANSAVVVLAILFNEAGRYPSDHYPVAARVEIR